MKCATILALTGVALVCAYPSLDGVIPETTATSHEIPGSLAEVGGCTCCELVPCGYCQQGCAPSSCKKESNLDKDGKTDRNDCATKHGILNAGQTPKNCRPEAPNHRRSSECSQKPPLGVTTPGLPPGTDPEMFKILAGIQAFDIGLASYETPIAIRFTTFIANTWWNCIATYSAAFKDAFTNARPEVVVSRLVLHTTTNRAIACAHAAIYLAERLIPKTIGNVLDTYIDMGIPGAALGLEPSLVHCGATLNCGGLNSTVVCGEQTSLDMACLQDAVTADGGTNTRLVGQVVALQSLAFAMGDGWNQFGHDDKCQVNCRPFKDTTNFKTKSKNPTKWRPILEDNGAGFFYKAQHVTPHIGEKGKLRFLTQTDRKGMRAVNPHYSRTRRKEAIAVVKRMQSISDKQKVEVETFNDKLSMTNFVFAAFLPKCAMEFKDRSALRSSNPGIHCSFERMVHFVMSVVNSEYDSTVIVWKEKVRYNLVRPTTVIKRWGNADITTWSPYKDNGKFVARDFEAYKRVMPHAEYPSGSACMCQTMSDTTLAYLATFECDRASRRRRRGVVDSSTMSSNLMPIIATPFKARASSVEPGKTPAETIILNYASVKDMARACSSSRLDGGMHFQAAVPGGEKLCQGIGTKGVKWAYSLL